MKKFITLILVMFAPFAFAFGNDQNQNQGQAQQSNSAAIAAAAASNKTIVDMSLYTKNQSSNKNQNTAKGGAAYSNSTSKSKSNSGGNSIANVIEGDKIPVSSAIAGTATECVNVMAAQGQKGGLSLGGASAECQAAIAAKLYFDLAATFKTADPEMAQTYLKLGHKYALKAAPGSAQVFIKDASETVIDLGLIIGIVTLFL